jgi:DNA-binding ferritin-like protein
MQTFKDYLNENAQYSHTKGHSMIAVHGFALLDQIKIFHWQTEVGDAHKALGDFYNDFAEALDELVEVIMGKYGRITMSQIGKPTALVDISEMMPSVFVEKYIRIFEGYRDGLFAQDPEIKNIIEEIIARHHKLKYLLTMS